MRHLGMRHTTNPLFFTCTNKHAQKHAHVKARADEHAFIHPRPEIAVQRASCKTS